MLFTILFIWSVTGLMAMCFLPLFFKNWNEVTLRNFLSIILFLGPFAWVLTLALFLCAAWCTKKRWIAVITNYFSSAKQ